MKGRTIHNSLGSPQLQSEFQLCVIVRELFSDGKESIRLLTRRSLTLDFKIGSSGQFRDTANSPGCDMLNIQGLSIA